MKPKCRIKLTLKCNMNCSYCINKCREYRAKWKKVDRLQDIPLEDYRSVIISGGEPTILTVNQLISFSELIRENTGEETPVYLQTNGFRLTKELIKLLDNKIDGIGYSIHDVEQFKHILTRLEDIARIKPIRIYVQDKVVFLDPKFPQGPIQDYDGEPDEDAKTRQFLQNLMHRNQYFSWRIWKDGEFDATEHIYVLKKDL